MNVKRPNDLITLEEYKADADEYDKKISALEAESNQARVPDLYEFLIEFLTNQLENWVFARF